MNIKNTLCMAVIAFALASCGGIDRQDRVADPKLDSNFSQLSDDEIAAAVGLCETMQRQPVTPKQEYEAWTKRLNQIAPDDITPEDIAKDRELFTLLHAYTSMVHLACPAVKQEARDRGLPQSKPPLTTVLGLPRPL